MIPPPTRSDRGLEVPVWLFAPLGRDARLLRNALAGHGHDVRILEGPEAFAVAFERDAAGEDGPVGVLVLTQEALTEATLAVIERHLRAQAPWEELPVMLLVDAAGHTVHALSRFQSALPRSKALVLQRPIRLSELESAVETMRQSRLRQYALRDFIERQETLRRELNHRVKNILATVQALHGLTASTTTDLAAFNDSFEGRLEAMSGVHQVLQDDDYATSEFAAIAEAILAPYRGVGSVEIGGERVRLQPEAAQGLALVLHELATNASKYGALSRVGGRVRLSWTRAGERFEALWTELGGPDVETPTRVGYGTRFIEMTMRGYGGTADFDYAAHGLEARLSMPLPEPPPPPSPDAM